MKNKSKELKIAIKAALKAGKILEKHFETDQCKKFKEHDKSVSIKADVESEKIIKKIIEDHFPKHCFLGEEFGSNNKVCNYVWHVDPVDGTRNFANGIPYTCLSIALECTGELIVGVIYSPMMKSLFYAEKGKGAYLNDKRIFVSKDTEHQGMVTVSAGKKENDQKLFRELLYKLPGNTVKTVRDFGCAALNLAYVARGSLEAEIELGLNTHDFSAGILLVQEAGGKITKLDGSSWKFPETHFIASNGVFHEKLVAAIKNLKSRT